MRLEFNKKKLLLDINPKEYEVNKRDIFSNNYFFNSNFSNNSDNLSPISNLSTNFFNSHFKFNSDFKNYKVIKSRDNKEIVSYKPYKATELVFFNSKVSNVKSVKSLNLNTYKEYMSLFISSQILFNLNDVVNVKGYSVNSDYRNLRKVENYEKTETFK